MNDSPYGLTASIWTRDIDRAAEIGARVETGTVYHEPLRLSRPASHLDRRQGHRPRRRAVQIRLRRADPAEKLSPARRLTSPSISEQDMSVPTANWSYPTAIRFGAGRIKELADACRSAGHQAPAARHRRGPRQAPHHASGPSTCLKDAGFPVAMFADVQPNPVDSNRRGRHRRLPRRRP